MESAIDRICILIGEGDSFTFENFCYPNDSGSEYGGSDKPEWLAWKTRSYNIVCQLVEAGSPAERLIDEAKRTQTEGNYESTFERTRSNIVNALQMTFNALSEDTFGELKSPKSEATSLSLSNKVFIVHGHDQALKTDVERFVHQIGLQPIVLHRQPDKGRTIIEKFEEHSDVGYAFILLTPDDVAYSADEEKLPDSSRKKELRARPNVIFEFGFFVARLGRERVCCLYKESVVLPSDLAGLIYKKVNGSIESLGFSIIQELQAVGYQIQL